MLFSYLCWSQEEETPKNKNYEEVGKAEREFLDTSPLSGKK